MDDARHAALLGVKLRALAGQHGGEPVDAEVATLPGGVGMVHDGAAWMLFEGDGEQTLGPALAWAVRRHAQSLDLVLDSGGGTVARRSTAFDLPIAVWFAEGRTLLPVPAAPLPEPSAVADEHAALAPLIRESGALPLTEHGVLMGEVRGLEVCRVVDQPTTGFFAGQIDGDFPAPPSGLQLEVGVGAADREAFQLLHGDVPTVQALTNVVAAVTEHRTESAPQHPLNRLGRERFLRWRAEQSPETVGLVELRPAEPPIPRKNLKDPTPCVAVGRRADGRCVRVVFSSGVDLDLLPFVADVQLSTDEPVVVAVPARDLVPVLTDVSRLLRRPVELVGLD